MTRHRDLLLLSLKLAFAALATLPTAGWAADSNQPARMLLLTQSCGSAHRPVRRADGNLSVAELAMQQLAERSGQFTVDLTQDAARDLTRENLENYDIVAFYSSGDLPIPAEELDYFLNDWLKERGHGFIGIHSAADTLKGYPPYGEMLGGKSAGHPWGQWHQVTMAVHDSQHPAVRPFDTGLVLAEEIYRIDKWRPEEARVLMSLDIANCALKRPWHIPVIWVKPWGEGRIVFNSLGHRLDTWQNEAFLQSLVGAVRWIRRLEDGEATPNPEVSARQQALSREAAYKEGITEESLADAEAKRLGQKAGESGRSGRGQTDSDNTP